MSGFTYFSISVFYNTHYTCIYRINQSNNILGSYLALLCRKLKANAVRDGHLLIFCSGGWSFFLFSSYLIFSYLIFSNWPFLPYFWRRAGAFRSECYSLSFNIFIKLSTRFRNRIFSSSDSIYLSLISEL